MKKKIIILGASGLLGTSISKIFKKDGIFEIIELNHFDIEINNSIEIEKIINKLKPDIIINCIAKIGINICEENPNETLNTNAVAIFHLSKICKKQDILLIQTSTHAVFNGTKDENYLENDQTNPVNIYAYSKLLSEYFVKMNSDKYYILRLATMYGTRRNNSLGFVDKMIERMKNNQELKVSNDRMDSPTYADNVAEQISFILKQSLPFGTYHVSDEGRVSYYEFITYLAKLINYKGIIKSAKDTEFKSLAPNPLKVGISSNLLKNKTFWKDALKKYVNNEKIRC